MSDISKCYGVLEDGMTMCFRTNTCWRYLAPTDELYQSYVSATFCVANDYCNIS